ncbi:anthrone oxygenase family protein [Streptomyces sp. NPDC001941]|uniref:anthrone oxygenase family protein n=1 Tax=Streptomyces sp. NPDC001941 TaxID=3154659 RepID=UPI0033219199
METARLAALVAATLTTGLVSGLFYGFACSVMLALKGSDDRTFIDVMQRINRAILNGWFVLGYIGAFLFTGIAVGLQFAGDGNGKVLVPAIAALVTYLGAMSVTNRANIPLNNELEAAGPPSRIAQPGAVRVRFEATWVRWNVVRAALCSLAMAFLCWALVAHGAG